MSAYRTYIKCRNKKGIVKEYYFDGFADNIFIGDELDINNEICKVIGKEVRQPKFKAVYIVNADNIKATDEMHSYYTVEELKADTMKVISDIAEMLDISGDFHLTMTIEKNGEYYDSDEATANYTNGVLTIEA